MRCETLDPARSSSSLAPTGDQCKFDLVARIWQRTNVKYCSSIGNLDLAEEALRAEGQAAGIWLFTDRLRSNVVEPLLEDPDRPSQPEPMNMLGMADEEVSNAFLLDFVGSPQDIEARGFMDVSKEESRLVK